MWRPLPPPPTPHHERAAVHRRDESLHLKTVTVTPSPQRRWSTIDDGHASYPNPLFIDDPQRRDGAFMEPSGRNRSQPVANRPAPKRLKSAYRQPVATDGNGFGAHGKEGVDGSSPSEGFMKRPAKSGFLLSAQTSRRHLAGTRRVHFRTRGHSRVRSTSRDHRRGVQIQLSARENACKRGADLGAREHDGRGASSLRVVQMDNIARVRDGGGHSPAKARRSEND